MFPWEKQFPFNQSGFSKHINKMNPKEVENYIQHVMTNVFGGDFIQGFPFQGESPKKESNNNVIPDIFETSDFVYVKLPTVNSDRKNIKIQHTNHQLIVMNYPKDSEQTKYMLPSPVRRKGTRARYIEDFIEIQFIKLKESSLSEVDISF